MLDIRVFRRARGCCSLARRSPVLLLLGALLLAPGATSEANAKPRARPVPRETRQETLKRVTTQLQSALELSDEQVASLQQVFDGSKVIGAGNPRLSVHPLSRADCLAARARKPLRPADESCHAPNMVRISSMPDAGTGNSAAGVCIDQFEFPNLLCEYPIVHVTAREAALLCEAVGKRLCDAHEWEGSCAGSVEPPERDYAWSAGVRKAQRRAHNLKRQRLWAYGPRQKNALCATRSFKTPGCPGSGYDRCGSNTYPAGSFPACVSPLGVYDQHGNVAEHMSLPLAPEQLGSDGGHGATEMKGSWFIFSRFAAHPDDCRWRAPDWHASAVLDNPSHSNYHLGFRCCSDEPSAPPESATLTEPAVESTPRPDAGLVSEPLQHDCLDPACFQPACIP
jgi:formylglycine-generating enzyme